jgi:hypothetical protein
LCPKRIGTHQVHQRSHRRENHIRAKYRDKAWMIPTSAPSFTDFAEIELRILNDRSGASFRLIPEGQPHAMLDVHRVHAESCYITTLPNTTGVISFSGRPLVRLPPTMEGHQLCSDNYNVQTIMNSPSKSEEEASVTATDPDNLPGMKWTERWKETKGDSRYDECYRTQPPSPSSSDRDSASSNRPTPTAHGKHLNQYRVNIPPPSLNQVDNFFWPRYCPKSIFGGHRLRRSHFASIGTIGDSYIPSNQYKTRLASRSRQARDYSQIEHSYSEAQNRPTMAKRNFAMETIWDNLVPESLDSPRIAPASTWSTSAPQCRVEDLASSPSLQSDLGRTYGFHSNFPILDGISQTPWVHRIRRHNFVCYEWNYCMECRIDMDGTCKKKHACEICASSEHRATQHWHHLATAPLPEIQSKPKLSSFDPPSESPTMAVLETVDFIHSSQELTPQSQGAHEVNSKVISEVRILNFVYDG